MNTLYAIESRGPWSIAGCAAGRAQIVAAPTPSLRPCWEYDVELLRNDLLRGCTPNSVEVPALCGLESFVLVHHLASIVTVNLQKDQDSVALLRAWLPAGSITGAPKIRAMEIVAEIERVAREVYCGAIGFIGFNGYMDTNIAIRIVTIERRRRHNCR